MQFNSTSLIRRPWCTVVTFMALICASTGSMATELGRQRIERGEFFLMTGPAPEWVKPMEVPGEWDAKPEPGTVERWRHWLVDDQAYRVGGNRARYRDYAYEPVSTETLTDAGKFEIDFVPEFQQLTLHEVALRRGGSWHDRLNPDRITLARRESAFEQDMATGAVSALLLLDDVRVGDVVRIRFTVVGENPILSGLDMDGAGFSAKHPILERQFRILFDPRSEPQEFRDARVAAPQVIKSPGFIEWRYRSHGIAAQHDEGEYPHWYVAYPYVSVTEKRSWADVARWAKQLYPEPQPLPDDLRERIEQWRALPTLDARVSAALLAVQEDVRYFGAEIGDNTHRPAEPALVWSRRRGDCKDKSRLLVAIFDAMAIEAYPALVSASSGKAISAHPPAASSFDHVIVQVRDGERTLWLDPTRTQQRGSAHAQSIGDFGVALPVRADASALVPVSRNPDYLDSSRVEERFDIAEDGNSATLSVTSTYLGDAANRMRMDLAVSGVEAVSRRYQEVYRRRLGDLTVAEALRVDDVAEGNRLVLVERYKLASPWGAATSGERRLDLFADTVADSLRMPQTILRSTPLALAYPQLGEHRIELRLPNGWRWKGSPENFSKKDASVDYSYVSGQKDNIVFLEQSVRTKSAVVAVDQVPEHLKLRREIAEIAHPNWILALPDREAGKQRDRRLNALIRDVMKENDDRKGKDDKR
jgi:hypothetical protein